MNTKDCDSKQPDKIEWKKKMQWKKERKLYYMLSEHFPNETKTFCWNTSKTRTIKRKEERKNGIGVYFI